MIVTRARSSAIVESRAVLTCLVFLVSILGLAPRALCEVTKQASSFTRVRRAAEWIVQQQNPSTGLFRSYDIPGDKTAWTYDQGLGIIVLGQTGNLHAARRCAEGMLRVRSGTRKVWVDSYDAETGEPIAKATAVGPNAWMGLGLLGLHAKTKEAKYLQACKDIADFILQFQVSGGKADGVVTGGLDEHGKLFPWSSTEHNADAIAFLAAIAEVTGENAYREAAVRITQWLNREMWDVKLRGYLPGYENTAKAIRSSFPERLDSQTWTILGQLAAARTPGWPENVSALMHNGLPWIDQYLRTVQYEGKTLRGFGKISLGKRATDSFWSEGTAGWVLAARRVKHAESLQPEIEGSLVCLQRPNGALPCSVGVSLPKIQRLFGANDILVAHFEGHPNCLFGEVGVYGDGEPDWDAIQAAEKRLPFSWYYGPDIPGYDEDNVHTGHQCFRLVNAGQMCKTQHQRWASFGLDMGPQIGPDKKIKPLDVSQCKQLVFWARTDNQEGAVIKVLFRDARARSYRAQVEVSPTPSRIDDEWQMFTVDLRTLPRKVDLSRLVHVGFEFGSRIGNPRGTIIYIDDVGFLRSPIGTKRPLGEMPTMDPEHWPFDSVAGTAWLIFAELDINPFTVGSEYPTVPIEVRAREPVEELRLPRDQRWLPDLQDLDNWMSFAANLDGSYRNTQFHKSHHNSTFFQWDARVELWLPPSKSEFSWGPYVRLAGITSSSTKVWENAWLARPGFGIQAYPFSFKTFRDPDSIVGKVLGPMRLFYEYNCLHYWGGEPWWRPDRHIRAGAEYWKEMNANNTDKPWWAEIWSGMTWQRVDEWNQHCDNVIFGASTRLGVRSPKSGILSMFTPYVVAESSLTENEAAWWENRLLLGAGIRFAPHLKEPRIGISRFVIFAEYVGVAAYYRDSAPSSIPDYDFRIGISISIGEWFK